MNFLRSLQRHTIRDSCSYFGHVAGLSLITTRSRKTIDCTNFVVWRARPFQEGEGSGIVAYTELCWRQDLVASNQIAASFHVTNKTLRVPRLIIRDTLVHSSLNMAGGLDVFIEEASASLRYQSLKKQTEASCKGLRQRNSCENICARAPRVPHCGRIIAYRWHNSAYAMPPDPSPLERVWLARLQISLIHERTTPSATFPLYSSFLVCGKGKGLGTRLYTIRLFHYGHIIYGYVCSYTIAYLLSTFRIIIVHTSFSAPTAECATQTLEAKLTRLSLSPCESLARETSSIYKVKLNIIVKLLFKTTV